MSCDESPLATDGRRQRPNPTEGSAALLALLKQDPDLFQALEHG
jgi:hypothetical protein